MSQKLEISETGLKLIKAFEGYRPVDRELLSGQRIVGYGHRLYSEDAVMMSKSEAEEVLRSDLEPFEDMINTQVHAPITQSQFDALCSFAFNIGPKAFLKSDTLRALNNGRPLDAANGFDVWRKSEIAGKTFVVDALMRRRTAEKALFLLTDRNLPAGREDLPPVKDTTIEGLSTEDAYPILTEEESKKFIAPAPYSGKSRPSRRREDGPAGVLELSELDIIDEADLPDLDLADETNGANIIALDEALVSDDASANLELSESLDVQDDALLATTEVLTDTDDTPIDKAERTSPIAAAASDIVARLDALIEDVDTESEEGDKDWPETLLGDSASKDSGALYVVDETTAETAEDEKAMEDSFAPKTDSDAKVIDLRSRTERFDEDATNKVDSILPEAADEAVVNDDMATGTSYPARTDSAAKYIETYAPESDPVEAVSSNTPGLWIPVLVGFILIGTAGGVWFRGAELVLGEWGPIIVYTSLIIGAGLILTGIYAHLRKLTRY